LAALVFNNQKLLKYPTSRKWLKISGNWKLGMRLIFPAAEMLEKMDEFTGKG